MTWRARPTRSSPGRGPTPPASPRKPARPAPRAAVSASGPQDRSAVNAFISREREFLQSLAGLVQEHAETVKGMAKSTRARRDRRRASRRAGRRSRPRGRAGRSDRACVRSRGTAAGRARRVVRCPRSPMPRRRRIPRPLGRHPDRSQRPRSRSPSLTASQGSPSRRGCPTARRRCASRSPRPRPPAATVTPRATARCASSSGARTDEPRRRAPVSQGRRGSLPRGPLARVALPGDARSRVSRSKRARCWSGSRWSPACCRWWRSPTAPSGACGRRERRPPHADPYRFALDLGLDDGPSTSPWITSTARVSPATVPRCAERASVTAGPAVTPSWMRSATSNPADFRASWTALISSRATPSRRRSSVRCRSRATVTPPSLATPHPSRTSWERSTSPGPRRTSPCDVGTETVAAARELARERTVIGGERGRDLFDPRAERGAEGPEVRLGVPAPERRPPTPRTPPVAR